ncbi:type II secretion system minor pseudopilin GspJ [Photobacterium sp. 1_MG-2023]|uniref:type II secretion system minor pseudopilin GspJ n=1 Tax=Photobacterium sp. 1_MG-2023 TaxID=3062646 RepID=UPI0026E147CB|nr:type II secretion system minor pseudopilin GspJ [Photobacterium sp. 1_MG-2023]MDO6707481.1 type II secretion system minor pseudopilin GspJ [Photobacterium sp. 1_MG-2023]
MKTDCHSRQRSAGFTLLEVLVAIAVFAMLSISAYQVMNGVQRSDEQSREHNTRLQEIQRAMVMLDGDFRQMVARQVRQQGNAESGPLLQSGEYLLDSASHGIIFTRDGWQNPQQMFPRSEILRVGYRIVEENLERVWFRYPDTVVGAEPLVRQVLTGVTALKFRFYGAQGWQENWTDNTTLPKGIEVTLTLKDFDKIERVYLLPEAKLPSGTKRDDEADS